MLLQEMDEFLIASALIKMSLGHVFCFFFFPKVALSLKSSPTQQFTGLGCVF